MPLCDMEQTKSQKRTEFMIRWSPLFLLGAIILLLVSLWLGPFSPTYLFFSIMSGLLFTALTLIVWRLESYPPIYWVLLILTVILVGQGGHWAASWAFPEMRHRSWGVTMQYMGAIFSVFFLALLTLRSFIRRHISNKVGNFDGSV